MKDVECWLWSRTTAIWHSSCCCEGLLCTVAHRVVDILHLQIWLPRLGSQKPGRPFLISAEIVEFCLTQWDFDKGLVSSCHTIMAVLLLFYILQHVGRAIVPGLWGDYGLHWYWRIEGWKCVWSISARFCLHWCIRFCLVNTSATWCNRMTDAPRCNSCSIYSGF